MGHTTRSTTRRIAGSVMAAAAVAAVTVAGVGNASADQAVGLVLAADSPTAIAGNYIVKFKDGAVTRGEVGATARQLAGDYDGQVARTYDAVSGFHFVGDATEAARLAADPAVAYVEQDQTVSLDYKAGRLATAWGVDRSDQRKLPLDDKYTPMGNGGEGVSTYIIDTGVRQSHQDFGGRAAPGFDAVTSGGKADDCHGHGTHVAGSTAGTTYGIAPKAKIFAVRVLGCQGSGSNSGVVAGIDWVAKNAAKPAVANMSLGGGVSQATDDAVRRGISAGVVFVLAAGNDKKDACSTSPARTPEAITVAASQRTDSRASFTNWGKCVDIWGPGVDIPSAWKDSDTATKTISGTSMASPHVAGAAALFLEANPTGTPAQIAEAMLAKSTPDVIKDPNNTVNKLMYVGS